MKEAFALYWIVELMIILREFQNVVLNTGSVKMNEKRFIRNIMGDIYDSKIDKWFEEDYKGKPLDYDDDLIVFLNELSEEVGRLKKYCNSYKDMIILTSVKNKGGEICLELVQ